MFIRVFLERLMPSAAAGDAAIRRSKLSAALLLAGASLVLFVAPASGHHSFAKFDSTREVVLKGTVREMEWTNPHVWIRLDVPDAEGNVVMWGIEASNPLDLGRKGWTRNTFKPGDEVTITVNPAKGDRPFGGFVKATLPDGTELSKGSVTGDKEKDSAE